MGISLNATWVFSHLPTRHEWVPLCFRQTQWVGGAKEEKEKNPSQERMGKRGGNGPMSVRETALFTRFPPAEIDLKYDISNTGTFQLTFPGG